MNEQTNDKHPSGKWAAAVAGAGAGAVMGAGGFAAAKASGGVKGMISDSMHQQLDQFSTLEKTKALLDKNQKQSKGMFEAIEKSLENGYLSKQPIPEHIVNEAKTVLGAIKQAQGEAIPEEAAKQLHEGAKALKSGIEKLGFKKSFAASIPGGVKGVATGAALIGAYLAYKTVSGIEKSNHSAIERLEHAANAPKEAVATR